MLPQEHVHEADEDHPRTAVHRHLQPHSNASHDPDHMELADADEHVVWLDSVAVYQAAYLFSAPALPPAEGFELVPALADWVARPDYDTAPPHGPPKASLSPRAPPCLPV